MSTALAIEALEVSYGSAKVCRGVGFDVAEGEVVLLMGANGAGKTTVLRTIAGLKRPSGGRISLRGRDITGWPGHRVVRAGIAMVPEGRQVFPEHTVEENLLLGGYVFRRARKTTRQQLDEVLGLFPALDQRRGQRAGTLSGGEAQMLAVGRALMARPQVLMLDEPSLGLSPLMVQQVFGYIRRLNTERGLTVLLVEQAAAAAMAFARHAYVLDAGTIVLGGTAAEVARDPRVQEIYLGAAEERAEPAR